jgi:chromosomal replication initiation ATPase DnaA
MKMNYNNTFNTFIATESNVEEKQVAFDYASDISNFQTLVISSSLGNGATHLAWAIVNEITQNEELENYYFVSFETLDRDILKNGELSKEMLNSKSVVVIDSYFNWDDKKSNYLISTLEGVKTKVIITCNEETIIPVEHFRINISCPNKNDTTTIIESLLIKLNIYCNKEIIDFIVEKDFTSVRILEGFVIALWAKSHLENEKVDLNYTKKVFEELKSKL